MCKYTVDATCVGCRCTVDMKQLKLTSYGQGRCTVDIKQLKLTSYGQGRCTVDMKQLKLTQLTSYRSETVKVGSPAL